MGVRSLTVIVYETCMMIAISQGVWLGREGAPTI